MTHIYQEKSSYEEYWRRAQLDKGVQPFSSGHHWDLLILTDYPDLHELDLDPERTLILCYDSESSECLNSQGFHVRNPSDGCLSQCPTFVQLYEHYSRSAVVSRADVASTSKAADVDIATVFQHVRHKAVEVYGPILYVWEMTANVLLDEMPRSIRVIVRNAWLAAVLNSLISGARN